MLLSYLLYVDINGTVVSSIGSTMLHQKLLYMKVKSTGHRQDKPGKVKKRRRLYD